MAGLHSHSLDADSKEFLAAVYDSGGRASTRVIRDKTRLSESKIQYRYKKLEEQEFIEVVKERKAANGVLMKEAVLTDAVFELIEEYGLLDDSNARREEIPEGRDEQVREYLTDSLRPRIQVLEKEQKRICEALKLQRDGTND